MHDSVSRELNDITALLSNCLEAFTSALFVSDDSGLLRLRAFHSLSKHIVPNAQFSPEDGGLIGWVAKSKQPLSIDHFDRNTKTLPYYQGEEDIKSFMALPLKRGDGVLSIDSKRQYVFTSKAQKLLGGFVTVIGNTLAAERAGRRHLTLRQLLTLWYRADVLPADADDPVPYLSRLVTCACTYLQADAGLVVVPVREGEFLQPVAASGDVPKSLLQGVQPSNQGLIGWIYQNRKSLLIPKFRTRTRIPFLFGPKDGIGKVGALIGMPLAWDADQVGGVITFTCRSEARWSREEIGAITSVVRRATLVLQNFTLRRELALLRNLDPVTEICNTEAFNRVLRKRMDHCRNADVELGLAIISVEGLEALSTEVALPDLATLRQRITSNLLQRLRGKQLMGSLDLGRFAVLFENESSAQINANLTAMIAALQQEVLKHVGGLSQLQAHFGFALYPQDASATDELWTSAFQALTNRTTGLLHKAAVPDG
jgi:GAF domain-containing protein